jgi:DNA-binding protein HU-beta
MTRRNVVDELYDDTGIPKKYIDLVLVNLFDTLKENLLKGDTIYLRGFGTFLIKKRKESLRRNPKTNEKIFISSHKIVYFKPGKKLQNIDACAKSSIPLSELPTV